MNGKKAKAIRQLVGFDVHADRQYVQDSYSTPLTAGTSRQQYKRAKRLIKYLPVSNS